MVGRAETSKPGVRKARADEIAAVVRTLTDSFHDDPVQRFLFPGDAVYARRGRTTFDLVTRRVAEIGVVHVSEGIEGVALWLPPGADFVDGWRGALFGARNLIVLGRAVRRGLALFAQLSKHHPRAPHWYLPVLGTATAQQGRGFGSALLAPTLARCDADDVPAYLESSKERNLPFYRRHGFEVVGTIEIENGPKLWPMLRTPRSRGG